MSNKTLTNEKRYNLYGPEFRANPFPTYAQMRAEEPVCYHPAMDGDSMFWFVTGFDEVETVLRDHKRFVKSWRNTRTPEELAKLEEPDGLWLLLDGHMLNTDAPDHTRLRALVNKAFTNRMTSNMRGQVQAIADELLDAVQDQGKMDLIDQYAFPIPIVVICDLLGIPADDRDRFRAWSNAFLEPDFSEEEAQESYRLLTEFTDYLRVVFEERRRNPQDDLITGLVQAEEAGDKLSEPELFAMVVLLIVAGHETTVNLIGNGTMALLQHPDQMALLKNDPSLIESAIEELLRYNGPVDRATIRFAAYDTELGGQQIKRGNPLSVVLTSANRDTDKFADADTLDVTRKDNRHLGFGFGIHYCVGAPLARMEGQIAINTLIQRLPNLQLAIPYDDLEWTRTPIIRGMRHMPVRWG